MEVRALPWGLFHLVDILQRKETIFRHTFLDFIGHMATLTNAALKIRETKNKRCSHSRISTYPASVYHFFQDSSSLLLLRRTMPRPHSRKRRTAASSPLTDIECLKYSTSLYLFIISPRFGNNRSLSSTEIAVFPTLAGPTAVTSEVEMQQYTPRPGNCFQVFFLF